MHSYGQSEQDGTNSYWRKTCDAKAWHKNKIVDVVGEVVDIAFQVCSDEGGMELKRL